MLGAATAVVSGVVLLLSGPASAAVRPPGDTVYPPGETCSVSLQVVGARGSGSVTVSPGQPFQVHGAGWTPLSRVSLTDATIRPKQKHSSVTSSETADAQGSFTVTITYGVSQVGTTHQFTANGTCTPASAGGATSSTAPQQTSATASTLVVVSGGRQTRGGSNGSGNTAVLGESATRGGSNGSGNTAVLGESVTRGGVAGRAVLGPLPFTGSEYALLGVLLAAILIFMGTALNRWARRHRRRA
jgi:hypothetical protein